MSANQELRSFSPDSYHDLIPAIEQKEKPQVAVRALTPFIVGVLAPTVVWAGGLGDEALKLINTLPINPTYADIATLALGADAVAALTFLSLKKDGDLRRHLPEVERLFEFRTRQQRLGDKAMCLVQAGIREGGIVVRDINQINTDTNFGRYYDRSLESLHAFDQKGKSPAKALGHIGRQIPKELPQWQYLLDHAAYHLNLLEVVFEGAPSDEFDHRRHNLGKVYAEDIRKLRKKFHFKPQVQRAAFDIERFANDAYPPLHALYLKDRYLAVARGLNLRDLETPLNLEILQERLNTILTG